MMAGETIIDDPAVIDKFWSKVEIRGINDCWEWKAGKGSHGYGCFYFRVDGLKSRESAHRVSLLVSGVNPPSSDSHALHKCDNKGCCNPRHLHWGTHADNMREAAERGRSKPGRTLGESCPKGHQYTAENTLTSTRKGPHGKRYTVHSCRECNIQYLSQRRAERREAA